MEPFHLSLQQVNFDEKDITDDDTLHAFSNLVSFESEFREQTSYSEPVGGRNVSPKAASETLNGEKPKYLDGGIDEIAYSTELHLVNSSYTESGRAHNDSLAIEPSEDSFVAFRDTVEALALQKSVIGKTSVRPASQEEVMRVIAETQNRLQRNGDVPAASSNHGNRGESETAEDEPITAQSSTESNTVQTEATTHATSTGIFQQTESHVQPFTHEGLDGSSFLTSESSSSHQNPYHDAFSTDDHQAPSNYPHHESMERASNASTKSISSSSRMDDVEGFMTSSDKPEDYYGVNTIIESTPGGYVQKELIKIPKREIEVSVQKHASSWFSRKVDTSVNQQASMESGKQKRKETGSTSSLSSTKDLEISPISERGSDPVVGSSGSVTLSGEGMVRSLGIETIGAEFVDGAGDNKQTKSLDSVFESSKVLVRDINGDSTAGLSQQHVPISPKPQIGDVPDANQRKTTVRTIEKVESSLEHSPVDSPGKLMRGSTPTLTSSTESSPARNIEHHSGFTVEELLRLTAKLEGQIEMLQAETSGLLKERSQLQSQVATILQQVTSLENSQAVLNRDCADLRADKETLRMNQGRLEQVIMDAHKLMQDKDQDLKTLSEDLSLSHEANEKLQETAKSKNAEILGREATIQDMKGKIAELYVDLQMSNQNKLLADSENKSLQGEVKSLALAKEWYQDQLQISQVAKGQLQKEISGLKSELIGQNTIIERLKNDNLSTKQRLAEAEQRALAEKEKLARHLEAIEAQMMEREATFVQLQQQKDTIEATLETKFETGAEGIPEDAKAEMQKVENELRRKQATIAVLEHEQTELRKRIALSQESILERDKTIESLGQKVIDLEVEFMEGQLALQQRNDAFESVRDEKMGLEVELSALKEEKQTISGALSTLKQDMVKVETSFKLMKNELKSKQEELSHLANDNKQLEMELANIRQKEQLRHIESSSTMVVQPEPSVTEEHVEVNKSDDKEVVELKESIISLKSQNSDLVKRLEGVRSESSLLITELKSQKASLDSQVEELKTQLALTQTQRNDETQEEKESIEEHQSLVKDLETAISTWSHQFEQTSDDSNELPDRNIEDLQIAESILEKLSKQKVTTTEFHLILTRLITMNRRLVQNCNKLRLSTAIRQSNADHKVMPSTEETAAEPPKEITPEPEGLLRSTPPSNEENQRNLLELNSLKSENDDLQRTVTELQAEISTLLADKVAMEQAFTAQTRASDGAQSEENDQLRTKIATLETESHREIAKQKAKALKLGKDLQSTLKELHEQKHSAEHSIASLESRLESTEAERLKLEQDLRAAQARFALDLDEKTTRLHSDLQEVQLELSTISSQKEAAEKELRSAVQRLDSDTQLYKGRIAQLENEISQMDKQLGEQREQAMNYQQLLIDLERERGRLAGLQQNHTALKEHAVTLEQALAQRESSVVGATSEVHERLQRREKQYMELSELLEEHRQTLEAEKQTCLDMKKELLTEKSAHVQVRRQLESLWLEHDQLKSEVELQRQEVTSLTEQLTKAQDNDRKHRAELEHMSQELRTALAERDGLQQEVQGQRAKDPVILEQLQSLEWQVNEKTAEISGLEDRLSVTQERQQAELSMLKHSLQNMTGEVSSLREELVSAKQEKANLQMRIAELKGALKTSIQQTRLLQKGGSSKPDASQVSFDLSALENLLQDASGTPTNVSKPLSFLQATLSSLRGEISSLQNQVDEHASAVETSSKAWREVEMQVQDLREVCKSSAADRAASQKLIEQSYAIAGETLPLGNADDTPADSIQ